MESVASVNFYQLGSKATKKKKVNHYNYYYLNFLFRFIVVIISFLTLLFNREKMS